jgi:hypothetical protein
MDLRGSGYTINQPMAITNGATVFFHEGWTKNAVINLGAREVRNCQERRQPVRKVPVRQVAREIAREDEHRTSSCRFDLRHRNPGRGRG